LLSVVTAVLLGGVNIFGGQGTVAGVVLAVFVIGVLRSGLALADVSAETQTIAVGALLVLSVVTPNLVTRVREAFSRRRTAAAGG
jgi:rhamnose transport system permease protein